MSGPLENENEPDNDRLPGPEAADGRGFESPGADDEFGENSLTWGTADPDFDRMLRDRIGVIEPLPTPAFAFERVLMAGRRRRARKLWAGATAAALVVMAGTAGTTVALNTGRATNLGAAGGPSSGTILMSATQAPLPSATDSGTSQPSPSASVSPSASASTPTPSATATAVPQCASDTFTLTVSAIASTPGATADELLIVLTNTSGHPCTTIGYPGLQLETDSGQLQSTSVTRLDRGSAKHLTVQAEQSVSTKATFTPGAQNATGSPDCALPSYALAVIPPNEKQQIVQSISGGPITVCGKGVLAAGPLVLGANG
jgi:hypothetical protein